MATSGSSGVNVTSHDSLWFNWSRTNYSIGDNYTDIYWELVLTSDGYGTISSTASKSWNITVNGTYYEGFNTVGIGANATKVLVSGTTRIYHNSDGSKQFSYSFNQYFGITFSGSWVGTVSGSGSDWLDTIPRKATFKSNGVSDFNDETNPTIYFDHPAGSALQLQARITSGEDTAISTYRVLTEEDIARGYYTFNLKEVYGEGDTPQTRIWNKSIADGKDTIDITFHLATWIGNDFEYSRSNTVKCTIKDCAPTLEPTVADTGAVSTALTGNGTQNSDTLIQYYNYVIATFNDTAKKGASIVSRSVRCGNQNGNVIYEDGKYIAIFNGAEDKTFVFTVRDNRGKTVERPASFNTLIPYKKLTCNTIVDKDLNDDNTANINLNISGDYFDGSFGTVNNKLTIEYRYKDSTTDFPNEWEPITEYTITDGEYSASAVFSVRDYRGTYTVQVRAKDAVYTGGVAAKDEIVKIIPVFDWGEDDFNFNVPVFKEGNPIGYYPIGSIYASEDNTDPGTLFGGTWQLMRTFYGGELVAYGTAWNSGARDMECVANTYYGISDIFGGGIYTESLHNYVPDILTGSSGTIWVQTKGIVGLVEANVEISGATENSGCYGIWFAVENKNPLPSSVALDGGGTLHAMNGYYSGNSTRFFYNIDDGDTGTTFFVNPKWTPYGGSFRPCHSGTHSVLQVKAFAKGGTNYMWKRIA